MKSLIAVACTTLLSAASFAAPPGAEAVLKSRLAEIFAKCADHYKALDAAATPLMAAKEDVGPGRDKSKALVPHGFNRKTRTLDMRNLNWWRSIRRSTTATTIFSKRCCASGR